MTGSHRSPSPRKHPRSAIHTAVRLALGFGVATFLLLGTLIAVGIVIVPTHGASAEDGEHAEGGAVAIVPAGETRSFVTALAGESVIVDGTVPDLFAAGRTVTIGGKVDDNAFVACQVARITGTVGGDLFVTSETATITGVVDGDVYASCREVHVAPGGSVSGHVYSAGNTIRIEGAVGKDLRAGAGALELSGQVDGNVFAGVGRLTVDPSARVGGDFEIVAGTDVAIPDGVVAGQVIEREPGTSVDADSDLGIVAKFFSHLLLFVGTLLVGVSLLRIFPRAIDAPAAALSERPTQAILVGFVLICGLTMLLAFGGLLIAGGLPIGSFGRLLALGGVWMAPFFLALPITALCTGSWLIGRRSIRMLESQRHLETVVDPGPSYALAVGLAALQALTAIPFLGVLVAFGIVCAGTGGMFLAARQGGRFAVA